MICRNLVDYEFISTNLAQIEDKTFDLQTVLELFVSEIEITLSPVFNKIVCIEEFKKFHLK